MLMQKENFLSKSPQNKNRDKAATVHVEFSRTVTIIDTVEWGKLVKSWVMDRNCFNSAAPPPKRPETIDELKQQCADLGIRILIDPSVRNLRFMPFEADTLAVRLPPKELMERSEAMLARNVVDGDHEYPLAGFYADFFEMRHGPKLQKDVEDFHYARVGEYTIASCQ
jgi:hypothetical protein